MAQGLTLEQLQGMGAKPVQPTQSGLTLEQIKEKQNQSSGGSFKYDVAPLADTRTSAEKIAQYNTEQAGYDKASKKANSFLGILGNTVKGVGETLASSEVGLGKTIAKIGGGKNIDTYSNNIKISTDAMVKTQKMIKAKELQGEDTSNLKRMYNSYVDDVEKNKQALAEASDLPSTGKVLGQLGGTALDVLTAGTYKGVATEAKTAIKAKSLIPSLSTEGAGKLFKSAKPIAETALKTLSPEAGKVVDIASKPTGIMTKKGLGKVLQGGGIGYASDVTQGLQGARGEDRTGANALIPGAGTVLGAGLPTVTETIQSFKNKFGTEGKVNNIIAGRKEELAKLDSYASLEKVTQKAKDKGFDVKDFVANSDLLNKSVDKTGTISTKAEGQAVEQVQNFINKNGEDVVNKILEKEGKTIDPAILQAQLKKSVMDSGLQGSNLTKALNEINSDMAGYIMRAEKDGKISLANIHKAKVDKYSNINFMTDPSTQKTAKVIANTLKQIVEKNTTSADVKAINGELSKYYTVIDYLEKLDGKKVDGGRLGKYFAKTVGAMVGGHFGPLGAIAGSELAGGIKGNTLSKTFGNKINVDLKSSQMMKDAIIESNKPRLALPAPKDGAFRKVFGSGKTIPIAPKNSNIEILGKLGIGR